MKWQDTAPFVQPGKIGDIGCSAGSWLKLAGNDSRFRESDFYGIELTRQFYQLCIQRKENGEFSNPNIWFSQKNAVSGLVFKVNSMNTIHSSSLTHEIESYGSHQDLLTFIKIDSKNFSLEEFGYRQNINWGQSRININWGQSRIKFRPNEWYHTPGQALDPEPLIRLPFSGKTQGMNPCFPCTHSGMNKFTPLISLGNDKEINLQIKEVFFVLFRDKVILSLCIE